jgi:hypothetical protein
MNSCARKTGVICDNISFRLEDALEAMVDGDAGSYSYSYYRALLLSWRWWFGMAWKDRGESGWVGQTPPSELKKRGIMPGSIRSGPSSPGRAYLAILSQDAVFSVDALCKCGKP